MFIFILTYQQPLDEVEKYLDAHKAYLDRNYEAGNFLVSGRRNPRTGGVILCKAADKETAGKMMQEDPFYIHGIAAYDLIEFFPTKYAAGLELFIS